MTNPFTVYMVCVFVKIIKIVVSIKFINMLTAIF